MAGDRTAHPRAVGIRVCRRVSLAGTADLEDDAVEPVAGSAGVVAASVCSGLCAQKRRAYFYRALCVHAESTVSGVDDDRLRICCGGGELGDSDCVGGSVCCDLCSYNLERGSLPARTLCGLRCVCREGASSAATFDTGIVSGRRECQRG